MRDIVTLIIRYENNNNDNNNNNNDNNNNGTKETRTIILPSKSLVYDPELEEELAEAFSLSLSLSLWIGKPVMLPGHS